MILIYRICSTICPFIFSPCNCLNHATDFFPVGVNIMFILFNLNFSIFCCHYTYNRYQISIKCYIIACQKYFQNYSVEIATIIVINIVLLVIDLLSFFCCCYYKLTFFDYVIDKHSCSCCNLRCLTAIIMQIYNKVIFRIFITYILIIFERLGYIIRKI